MSIGIPNQGYNNKAWKILQVASSENYDFAGNEVFKIPMADERPERIKGP